MTRTVGILLIVAAVAACLIGGVVFGAGFMQGVNSVDNTVGLTPGGAALGFALVMIVLVAPLAGGGVIVLTRSKGEAVEQAEADALRKILDMVKTRGQVDVSEIIIELQSDLPAVQDMIYKLVGMGVFSGYVNWDEGMLYSAEASALHDTTQCKHCGGKVSLAGKGVMKCPFCGTEYFLAK
jgi:hypothetical protein